MKALNSSTVPTYDKLVWPTLLAIKKLGGSGTINEIDDEVLKLLQLPESIVEQMHGDTNRTEMQYRLAWARTHLKMVDAIENSARAVWSLLPQAQTFTSEKQIIESVKAARESARISRTASNSNDQSTAEETIDVLELGWKDDLLNTLKTMRADAFERLCKRILREAGFIDVEVTQRGSDGGIDGAGILRVNLLSFHVSFQCKRYKDSVGAPVVRDFRGASIGRSDKGLIITTGRFTTDARREAVRDGASPIDLIDGDQLCELLAKYDLGVATTMVPERRVNSSFFENI